MSIEMATPIFAQIFEFPVESYVVWCSLFELLFVFVKPQVPTRLDGIPADVLHYNQLDLPSGPSSEHDHGSPRFPHENVDYADIRPTVL